MALGKNVVRVGIVGATGRMGARLIALIGQDEGLALAEAVDRPGHPRLGEDVGPLVGLPSLGVPLTDAVQGLCEVVIDFSTPEGTLGTVKACVEKGIPLVVGTTGFEPEQREDVEGASERIAVLLSSNFSRAVNLLMSLSGIAARALGDRADIEIVERHHRFKKDAPSGTALRLAEVIAESTGISRYVHGRQGQVGERPQAEIGVHALRTGDNPGEHTVVFGLMGECLELSHRALSRDGFALGALDAGKFLAGKPAGRYTMDDLFSFGS